MTKQLTPKLKTASMQLGDKAWYLTAKRKLGKGVWEFACDCGNTVRQTPSNVKRGNTKSCGCQKLALLSQNSSKRTHGMYRSPEYRAWRALLQRCTNPKAIGWHRYGGRGIQVCDRWMNGFQAFYSDMGPRPSDQHSIERVNNDGNYEPSNCKWESRVQQANNTSRNAFITYEGDTYTISQLARKLQLTHNCLSKRIQRGWTPDRWSSRSARSTQCEVCS